MLFNIAGVEAISRVLSNPTWDVLALIFFFVAGFLYGLFAGKKKLLAVLFAIYISTLLFTGFTYLDFFIEGRVMFEIFLFRSGTLFVLIIITAILFGKTIFRGRERKKKPWQVFILSFLEIGLLMSTIFQLLPTKELYEFSPIVETLFASEKAHFWWLVLPLISLLFIVKRRKIDY
ncbi:MAG: hypothetical protein ABII97_01050 [Patescibacteria group bacterium]